MGHQHISSHAVFPFLAYATVSLGSFQGWACMTRFRARRTTAEWTWLGIAAVALGSGLWGLRMISLLGFDTPGVTVRHDALLTALSGVLGVGSALSGLLLADTRRTRRGLLAAGAVMVGGLVGARALGMAALDAPAAFHTSAAIATVAVAQAVAGVAGTLWLVVTAGQRVRAVGISLLTGALLCGAQYTDLAAITVTPGGPVSGHGGGLSGPALVLAVAAVVILVALTVAFNLYVTPVQDVHDSPAPLVTRAMPPHLLVRHAERVASPVAPPAVRPGASPPPGAAASGDVLVIEAGPVVNVAG